MKVSENFSNLLKESAIFIVTGKQFAKIYQLRKGEIKEKETIEVNIPKYSDKEGFFEHRGAGGTVLGSGSVYQSNDNEQQVKFLKELKKAIKGIKRPFDSIYLFAPTQSINIVADSFTKLDQAKIRKKLRGNFTKHHPTELLEKVSNKK